MFVGMSVQPLTSWILIIEGALRRPVSGRRKKYPPGAPRKKRSEGIVFFVRSGDLRAQRASSFLAGGASFPTNRSVRFTSRAATRPMITPVTVPLTISTGR